MFGGSHRLRSAIFFFKGFILFVAGSRRHQHRLCRIVAHRWQWRTVGKPSVLLSFPPILPPTPLPIGTGLCHSATPLLVVGSVASFLRACISTVTVTITITILLPLPLLLKVSVKREQEVKRELKQEKQLLPLLLKVSVKRDLKQEKQQAVKQEEDRRPFRSYYPCFGTWMTNDEHITALFARSAAMALVDSDVPRLDHAFENRFCQILVQKGRANREIIQELSAIRTTFQCRRGTKHLDNYLKYMHSQP